jgi:hypothetical protein
MNPLLRYCRSIYKLVIESWKKPEKDLTWHSSSYFAKERIENASWTIIRHAM